MNATTCGHCGQEDSIHTLSGDCLHCGDPCDSGETLCMACTVSGCVCPACGRLEAKLKAAARMEWRIDRFIMAVKLDARLRADEIAELLETY